MEKDFNQSSRVKLVEKYGLRACDILNDEDLEIYYAQNVGYPVYSVGTHMRASLIGKALGIQIAHFLFKKFKSLPNIKCNIVFTGSSGSFLIGAALESMKNTLCTLGGETDASFREMERDMLRLIYIPKPGENRHDVVGEYDFFKSAPVIFIDDLIDSGQTLLRVIEFIAQIDCEKILPITQIFCERIFTRAEKCFDHWYDENKNQDNSKSMRYQQSDIEVYTLK